MDSKKSFNVKRLLKWLLVFFAILIPIIIHGLNDKRISPDNGKRIYNNIASKEKEWYPIPGGGHNNLSIFGGSKFKNKVINFYLAHLK